MNGYDYVMASVCAVMLLLSAFGLYVYFNARMTATANPKTKIVKEKSTKKKTK